MRITTLLTLFLMLLFPLGTVYAADGPDGSIHITSDRLDVYDDKGIVLFSGNVVATQDITVANSDKLFLYYDKKNGKGESLSGIMTDSGKIERIELEGRVIVKKGERTVTGDRGIFYNAEQKIIMTGNAVMMEKANVVRGDRITVFLDENRGVVDSTGGQRVTAVIYPDDTK